MPSGSWDPMRFRSRSEFVEGSGQPEQLRGIDCELVVATAEDLNEGVAPGSPRSPFDLSSPPGKRVRRRSALRSAVLQPTQPKISCSLGARTNAR
jgi:hypothetical protein